MKFSRGERVEVELLDSASRQQTWQSVKEGEEWAEKVHPLKAIGYYFTTTKEHVVLNMLECDGDVGILFKVPKGAIRKVSRLRTGR